MPETGETPLALAKSIAVELGEDWKAETGHWPDDAFLVRTSNPACKIHLGMGRSPSRQNKIEISGVYPAQAHHYRTGRARRDRTYSAPNKPAPAIARQIRRYLLPGYEAELARVCEIL